MFTNTYLHVVQSSVIFHLSAKHLLYLGAFNTACTSVADKQGIQVLVHFEYHVHKQSFWVERELRVVLQKTLFSGWSLLAYKALMKMNTFISVLYCHGWVDIIETRGIKYQIGIFIRMRYSVFKMFRGLSQGKNMNQTDIFKEKSLVRNTWVKSLSK